jgi:NADH:ubiquinone oxidoreductase subunit F (NADH-binding)
VPLSSDGSVNGKWSGTKRNSVSGPRIARANAATGPPDGRAHDDHGGRYRCASANAISGRALKSKRGFIFLRGEYLWPGIRLSEAIAEAYEAGYLGKGIMGSEFDFDITLHYAAGAYICGEETALLNALEGRRGQPRLRPPFPAVAGVYAAPTAVNNVETIMNVPWIIERGVAWYRSIGTDK